MSLTKLRFTNQAFSAAALRIFSGGKPVDTVPRAALSAGRGPGELPAPAGAPVTRIYDIRAVPAVSSNSPFLAPSIKHSHSFLSNTRTRLA